MADPGQERSIIAQFEALGMIAVVLDEGGAISAATAGFRALSLASADGGVGLLLEEALEQISCDHATAEGSRVYRIDRTEGACWYRDERLTIASREVAVLVDVSPEWRLLTRQAKAALAETKALRNEAHDNARRLRMTLARTRAALYEADYRFASNWVSPELPELAGLEAFSKFGDGTLNFFHPDDHETIIAQRENDKAGHRTLPAMVRLNRSDREFWVRVFREVERAPNGEASRFLGIVIDCNEEKRQESELKRARIEAEAATVAKSNFLASMSHEIRTPLNGVLGMAQALTADALTKEQREKVEIILDSGRTLMGLLNDVLDLSKIEAGKMEISCIDGDLVSTLERTRKLFMPKAEERDIRLSFDAGEAAARLSYDPVRVNQCVSNLLSNAVKFTERGEVAIRLKVEPVAGGRNMVTVSVSDTGIGMSAEAVSKLFSAFTQADASTSRRFGGTGLGLSITRQLARLMGGDVTAESAEGKGSTFRLTFLANSATSAAKVEDAAAATLADGSLLKRFAGCRVLLVDDNAVNRMVVRLFLAPLHPYIVEAENGAQALEKLAQEAFNIVLLDVHMPVMDGVECIQHIRASNAGWRAVSVLALTADAMSGDRERYLCMGMDDYVAKPIEQRELVSKVIALLARTMDAPRQLRQAG